MDLRIRFGILIPWSWSHLAAHRADRSADRSGRLITLRTDGRRISVETFRLK